MSKRKPIIKIQNIVASVSLNQKIDLQKIVEKFPQTEYNPSVFPGLVFRLKKPKTATLIFGTGKMVCTGAKSEKESRSAVEKVVKELRGEGIQITEKPVVMIQNIVASAELGGEIDLESLVYKLSKVMYEPEQFPGAVYRMDEPKVVFLIFSAGKLVCVGAKKEEFTAKTLGVAAETVLDRVHALMKRDTVGRTGVFVKRELLQDETFELALKKLADLNPAVRRRIKK